MESKLAKMLLQLSACEAAKRKAEQRASSLETELAGVRQREVRLEKRAALLEERELKAALAVEEVTDLKEQLHKVCVCVCVVCVCVCVCARMYVCVCMCVCMCV